MKFIIHVAAGLLVVLSATANGEVRTIHCSSDGKAFANQVNEFWDGLISEQAKKETAQKEKDPSLKELFQGFMDAIGKSAVVTIAAGLQISSAIFPNDVNVDFKVDTETGKTSAQFRTVGYVDITSDTETEQFKNGFAQKFPEISGENLEAFLKRLREYLAETPNRLELKLRAIDSHSDLKAAVISDPRKLRKMKLPQSVVAAGSFNDGTPFSISPVAGESNVAGLPMTCTNVKTINL